MGSGGTEPTAGPPDDAESLYCSISPMQFPIIRRIICWFQRIINPETQSDPAAPHEVTVRLAEMVESEESGAPPATAPPISTDVEACAASVPSRRDSAPARDSAAAPRPVAPTAAERKPADLPISVSPAPGARASPTAASPPPLRFKQYNVNGLRMEVLERYVVKCAIGKGAYGLVCAATDVESGPAQGCDVPCGGVARDGSEPGSPRTCSSEGSMSPPGSPHSMVAVKKIIGPFSDRTDCKRLLREIRLLRCLRHPNVLHLLDMMPPPSLTPEAWQDVYLVTRLFDTNLHRVIYSGQPLSDAHVQYLVWQLCRGLKYMHDAGVVHRDLKVPTARKRRRPRTPPRSARPHPAAPSGADEPSS